MRTFRLRFWLPFIIFLVFTLLLFAFSFFQYRNFQSNLEERSLMFIKEKLIRSGDRLERFYNNHLDYLVNTEVDDLKLSEDLNSMALVDNGGVVIVGSQVEWTGMSVRKSIPVFNDSLFNLAKRYDKQEINLSSDGFHVYVYEPILLPAQNGEIRSTRHGVLFCDFDLTYLKTKLFFDFLMQVLFVWGLGFVLLTFLYLVFYYGLTLPFRHLKSVINEFGLGKYSARAIFSGKGEFYEIGNAFNKMAIDVTAQQEKLKDLLEEEIQIENDLRIAKCKAEESDRLKSAFLANMSHEIRTPMNGILGFADLLKDSSLSSSEQQQYLSIIEVSGRRMLNLLNDLIDISKIESGQMTVYESAVDINEINKTVFDFFSLEAQGKGLGLQYENSLSDDKAIIKTDKDKFYAVLSNVLKNAIKYTDQGKIDFGYQLKDGWIEYFVKDTGIGVPEDRQLAIFDRFVQADIADSMAKQGAGLGLSISKAFVEMLGGKIWVESYDGKGSCFYFTIPYRVQEN